MSRGLRLKGAALLAAVALPLTGLVLAQTADAAPVAAPAYTPPNLPVTSTKLSLKMDDGVELLATSTVPDGAVPAGGWPFVLFPGNFGGNTIDITPMSIALAKRGFGTLTYYHRGMGGSGGEVQYANARDTRDIVQAIDWGLAHQPVNQDKVGLIGSSYGAGTGLIGALTDKRVKAVANLSGWTDLERSFYDNKTVNLFSIQALRVLSAKDKTSKEMETAFAALDSGNLEPGLAFARTRGAAQVFGDLDSSDHLPALWFSEPMNEVVLPILSTTEWFEAYPGRKRMELRPGDHGTPETAMIFGQPTASWYSSFRWMEANVAGYDTSINDEPEVLIEPRSSFGSGALEFRDDTLNGATTRFYLAGQPRKFMSNDAGTLATAAGTRTTKLVQGDEWIVRNGVPLISYGAESVIGVPPLVALGLVNPDVTGIFRGAELKQPFKLRGEVKPHLKVTPSAKDGTLVVHVLDVDGLGNTYAVAHYPYSWTDATAGKAMDVDFSLPYNAYDFKAGHRMVVTVSSSDTTYKSRNVKGSSFVLGAGSSVDLPVK